MDTLKTRNLQNHQENNAFLLSRNQALGDEEIAAQSTSICSIPTLNPSLPYAIVCSSAAQSKQQETVGSNAKISLFFKTEC